VLNNWHDHFNHILKLHERSCTPPIDASPGATIDRLLAEVEADVAAGKIGSWEQLGRTREEVERFLRTHCLRCSLLSPVGCGRTPHPCQQWGLLRQTALVGHCRRR